MTHPVYVKNIYTPSLDLNYRSLICKYNNKSSTVIKIFICCIFKIPLISDKIFISLSMKILNQMEIKTFDAKSQFPY